ncbi:MAG: hypothetical protein JW718_07635 [Desulfovibrionaceae bacterium]|nr:hypothetical protein [Desulfovibrionaceae bacterium]
MRIVCPQRLRPAVEQMLRDLDWSGLCVELIPAPEPMHPDHRIRAVAERNPDWYRELARTFQRGRRARAPRYADPRFKRGDIHRVLLLLLSRGTTSCYAEHLLGQVEQVNIDFSKRAA